MKTIFLIYTFLLLGIASSTLQAASSVGVANLKFVPSVIRSESIKVLSLNKEGIGELPFINKAGKIFIKVKSNRCYVDIDGDGAFDESPEKAIKVNSKFTIPVIYNGVEHLYSIKISFITKDKIFLLGSSILKGEYMGSEIILCDRNMNGDFSDLGIDSIRINDQLNSTAIQKVHLIGKNLYLIESENKGETLKFSRYSGPIAKVKLVPPDKRSARLHITSANNSTALILTSGQEYLALPGKYNITNLRSSIKINKNSVSSEGLLTGIGGSLVLKEGDNEIKTGGPYELQFEAVRSAEDHDAIKITSVSMNGASGIIYRATYNLKKKQTFIVCSVRSGNKEKELSRMEYG